MTQYLRVLWRAFLGIAGGMAIAAAVQAAPITGLYAFGDSLSDVGNDYLISGGAAPAAAYYSDSSTVGRFANGPNYVDYLAGVLGLGATPSVAGGNIYAYGGARTAYVRPDAAAFGALSFNAQLASFYGTHPTVDPTALYVLWIGSNDIGDVIGQAALGGNPSVLLPNAINTAMNGIAAAIQNLAARGATHFLVPNIPDLSLVPAVRQIGNPNLSNLARFASQQFNGALDNLLGLTAFGSLDIDELDVYKAQTDVTANPAAFGFTNVTSACYTGEVNGAARGGVPLSVCANPNLHLYFDYEHPSSAMHAYVGRLAVAAVLPEPGQLALVVVAGLAAFGAGRSRRVH